MRTENEEIRDHLKYLSLLARDYPSQAAAASEIISTQALLKLPKGTEHFMSDLHGENEAFVHILNSASGVIREKVDIVLGTVCRSRSVQSWQRSSITPTRNCPGSKPSARMRKRLTTGTQRPCFSSLISAGWCPPSIPGSMCAPACRPAVGIFWMSCSMPTLRTTTRTFITGRSWAVSSKMAAPTGSSSGCVSSSSGWLWTSCTSWGPV